VRAFAFAYHVSGRLTRVHGRSVEVANLLKVAFGGSPVR